jgi:hypothetical protein
VTCASGIVAALALSLCGVLSGSLYYAVRVLRQYAVVSKILRTGAAIYTAVSTKNLFQQAKL